MQAPLLHQAPFVHYPYHYYSRLARRALLFTPELQKLYGNINTCPEEYLLWFHHVSWDHKMKSGRSLWEELCHKYYSGVHSVRAMQRTWAATRQYVDKEGMTM